MDFKNTEELKNFIRGRVKQIIGNTNDNYQGEPESPMNIMLTDFPPLASTLEKLLTAQFRIFVNDIQWVAPKPTTFKIILPNGQFFNLIWNTQDFLAQVSGVKYDMLVLKDYERAIKAIAELLQYGPIHANLSPQDLAQQHLNPFKGEPTVEPPKPEEEPTK